MGRDYGYTSSNSSVLDYFDIGDFVEDYFSDINMSVTVSQAPFLYNNKTQFCKDAIDDGYPVIVGVYIFGDLIIGHTVVAYGYEGNEIYVHFGWSGGYTHVGISPYYYAVAYYFDINTNHVHSNNYTCKIGSGSNQCYGSFCPCGLKTIAHTNKYYESINDSLHNVHCYQCDHSWNEAHLFVHVGGGFVCMQCNHIVAPWEEIKSLCWYK